MVFSVLFQCLIFKTCIDLFTNLYFCLLSSRVEINYTMPLGEDEKGWKKKTSDVKENYDFKEVLGTWVFDKLIAWFTMKVARNKCYFSIIFTLFIFCISFYF